MGGIAKGSGMIHPNMATMLAVVTCDATVEPLLWRALFKRSAIKSFNQVRNEMLMLACLALQALSQTQVPKRGMTHWWNSRQELESNTLPAAWFYNFKGCSACRS